MDSEALFKQLVIEEMKELVADGTPLRVSFNCGTETYRQVMILAAQRSTTPRNIIQSAVRVFFTAHMLTGAK